MYKNKFVVYFKGVRGSHPVAEKEFMRYGGNTACIYVNVNNRRIILDAGSGIVNAAKQIKEERLLAQDNSPLKLTILLSHYHFDHIQGLPFFNYLHNAETSIDIFAKAKNSKEIKQNLSTLLFNKSFPVNLDEIKSKLNFYPINDVNNDYAIILKDNEQEPIITSLEGAKKVQENDVVITTMYSKTHPKDGVILYKISFGGKTLVYATDKESYVSGDKSLATFARDCNLLIHDSQYTQCDYDSVANIKQGYGHSSFEMAIKEKENTHAKNLAFFHYDTTYNDNKLDEIKKNIINITDGLFMPVENQKIEIL